MQINDLHERDGSVTEMSRRRPWMRALVEFRTRVKRVDTDG